MSIKSEVAHKLNNIANFAQKPKNGGNPAIEAIATRPQKITAGLYISVCKSDKNFISRVLKRSSMLKAAIIVIKYTILYAIANCTKVFPVTTAIKI